MASTTRKSVRSHGRQKLGAPPVVEDAKLSRMGVGEPQPRLFGKATVLMPTEPKAVAGTRNRMSGFRATANPPTGRIPKRGYSEQQPPKNPGNVRDGKGRSDDPRDGYVRLRVLVDDGELSIVGAKFVAGPYDRPSTVTAGLAYEVTLGSKPIAAGDIVDAGTWRSYPDPQGRAEMQGHHVTTQESYEITVRVPASALSKSALPKARITLYRWRGVEPAAIAEGRSMKTQLKGKVETVATLKGIQLARLPKQAQAELRRALE